MRRRLILGFGLIGTLVAIGCLWQTDWHERSIRIDDETRRYLFYAPDQYEGTIPLLVAFHGFSGTAERMRESSKLEELVNKHKFLLAYLDGNPSWHRPRTDAPGPDVRFFDELCEHLEKDYRVDSSRIYVTGMSMGGDFAIRLGGLRSHRIAAVASQGMITNEVVDAERPFPLLIVVGTEDDRVPESCFPRVPEAFRERGHEVKVVRPEGIGHRWHVPFNDDLWSFLIEHRVSLRTTGEIPREK